MIEGAGEPIEERRKTLKRCWARKQKRMAAVRVGKVASGPTARIRYTLLEEFLQPDTIQLEIGVLEETVDWSA